MAFGFYMNMERLSINIAHRHVDLMTNDNIDTENDPFLDEKKLLNNIENGFVAITQMSCYIESFLNTIINSCIGYDDEILLKCSIKEKIDIIFLHYGKCFKNIKSQHCWELFNKTTKVRNGMIHFKKTYVGDGSGIPDFQLCGERVAEFFTKENIKILLEGHIELAKSIASELSLQIFEKINVFECDGRDGLVNYVFDETILYIDESRFQE